MDGRGVTIGHRDDFERAGRWSLARRSLGVSSFGMNLVDIEQGYAIPEHDEVERDQEEVFIVLSGDVVAVVDGRQYPAPAGTFVRVDPDVRRTIRNDAEVTACVLVVSAPTTSGYEPMQWA
jgi:mannose-6-phosphate isomerase-like protein (cupin superfamily)